MLAFYADRISAHIAKLKDGGILCLSVPIARTGDQEYLPSELADLAGTPPEGLRTKNGRVIVHRPAEEVFSSRTMASFEGAPLCGPSHPPAFITPSNWRAWSSGHAQNVRRGPMLPNGDQTLVADLLIRDAPLAETVESGETRNVSCGYDCFYRPESDGSMTQTNIVGNHVAVLRGAGRAGPAVAIQDHAVQHYTLEDVLTKCGQVLARAHLRYPDLRPAIGEFFHEMDAVQVMDAQPQPRAQPRITQSRCENFIEEHIMGVDWRDKNNLKDLTWGQALVVLGEITESLAQRKTATATEDSSAVDLHSLVGDSPEAIQFCEAANALGRKLRGEPQAESLKRS